MLLTPTAPSVPPVAPVPVASVDLISSLGPAVVALVAALFVQALLVPWQARRQEYASWRREQLVTIYSMTLAYVSNIEAYSERLLDPNDLRPRRPKSEGLDQVAAQLQLLSSSKVVYTWNDFRGAVRALEDHLEEWAGEGDEEDDNALLLDVGRCHVKGLEFKDAIERSTQAWRGERLFALRRRMLTRWYTWRGSKSLGKRLRKLRRQIERRRAAGSRRGHAVGDR